MPFGYYDEPFGSKLARKNLAKIEDVLSSIRIAMRLIALGHFKAAHQILHIAVDHTEKEKP